MKLHLREAEAQKLVVTIEKVVVEDINAASGEYKSFRKEYFFVPDKKLSLSELKIVETKNDLLNLLFRFFIALSLMITGTYFKQ